MLGKILAFERRLILRSPLFWIVALVFGAIAFGSMASDNVSFGGGIGNVHRNAPLVVINLLAAFSLLSLLLVTIFIAGAALRDFEQNTAELFFTTPIRKRDYLLGRFGGGFLAAFGVMVVAALGLWLGSTMPWLDQARLGPTPVGAYFWSFGILVIPNLLFIAALMFAFATLTRSMLYTYLGAIGFIVLHTVAESMTSNLDARWIGALLDPFGGNALSEITRYWSADDNNSRLPPLSGLLLANRALWLAVSAALLFGAFKLFRADREGLRLFRRKAAASPATGGSSQPGAITLPSVRLQNSLRAQWSQFLHQSWFDLRSVLTGAPFLVMLVLGLLVMFTVLSFSGELYGTKVLPVTANMSRVLAGGVGLFLTLVLAIYAGELVWRERTLRVAEVADACAVPNWVPLAAKLVALVGVIAAFVIVGVVFCMAWQLGHGYTSLQLGLYAKIAVLATLPFLLTAALLVFLQTVSENKFFGYLLVVIFLVAQVALPMLGWNHPLYSYGKGTPLPLSDMNGYGQFLAPSLIFRAYWGALAAALLVVAAAFWPRGTGASFGERARRAFAQLRTGKPRYALAALLAVFVALGAWIFYNTNVLNTYRSEDAGKERQANFEKTYRAAWRGRAQPRITAVKADVDIYPDQLRAVVRGHYRLENKTAAPIEEFFLHFDDLKKVSKLDFAAHSTIKRDEDYDLEIVKLTTPMAPGGAMDFDFEIELGQDGFSTAGGDTHIVSNGTFFNSGELPHFGYRDSAQLSDRNDRRKYGLPELPRMAPVNDMKARGDTYISHDADWVDFETTVSTVPDQIALAPGYLQREWTAKDAAGNERRYFQYKSDTKILNFFSWLSARWAVKKDRWNDVAIEIYYDAQHAYNVERMIESVKKSLDYYTKNFSPYQFRQVRILEFPNYASFAQSFANTIPYSESIGFIADLSDKDAVDYVFYVTAHEVAHQWWAHQVIGANVQGATMLSESFAQYSALMVMEHEYGAGQMRKFLKYELDRYLAMRATERVKENPLALNENQQYIHYNKASVVLYALKDYIGEDTLNAALAAFLKAKAFQQPPYTTSYEFLDTLRAGTDPKWAGLISDLFDKITFFDNRVTRATAKKRADGKYDVTLELHAGKKYTDGVGKETDGKVDLPIDIGVFAKAADGKEAHQKVLYLEKREIKDGDSTLTLTVDGEPYEAGIDPYNKLVDRNSNDNRKKVTIE
jgi:ABC-type transport system involved in multi-copper enzyme maturation permease subunit